MDGSEEVLGQSQPQQQQQLVEDADCAMNLALSDPPRWGWTATGALADLLPPHERSRRKSSAVSYRKMKRKLAASAAVASRSGKGDAVAALKKTGTLPLSERKEFEKVVSTEAKNIGKVGPVSSSTPLEESKSTTSAPPLELLNGSMASEVATDACDKKENDVRRKEQAEPKAETDIVETSVASIRADAPNDSTTQQQQQPEKESEKPSAPIEPTTIASLTGAQQTEAAVPAAPPISTRKLLGMKRNLLGMEVKKIEASETNTNASDTTNGAGGKKGNSKRRAKSYECRVESLDKDTGVLDLYSYHRGREGFEPRDPDTGELRCPLEATDTNHNYDAPRMSFNLSIEFPLQDDDDTCNDHELATYRETLQWDLSDPTHPSPLVLANDIANEFGLKYGQMLDLALNIQSQIDAHTQQNCNYSAAISTEDPAGTERSYAGPAIQTHRYGQVVPTVPGGTRLTPKERQRILGRGTGSRAPSVNGSASGIRRKVSAGGSRSGDGGSRTNRNIDESFIEEVKRRSRAESTLDIAKKCKNGVVGHMERNEDFHCHTCHKRCSVAFTFACGNNGHTYCEWHCKTRLDERFNTERPILSYCPICSLNCTCSRCVRKLKSVAWDFKRAVESQGTPLEETSFDDLLSKCRSAQSLKPSKSAGADGKRRHSEVREDDDGRPPKQSPSSKTPQRQKRLSTGRAENRSRLLVPKPPLSEFPREIYGSLELEPGTPDDYLRVYTSNGIYLSDEFPEAWSEQHQDKSADSDSAPTSNGELVEDGNVDFCQVCRNHGNLLCCDYCPRAYHVDCIDDESNATSAVRWECVKCKKEKEGLPSDLVDTKKSIDLISASFPDAQVGDDETLKQLEALSGIHVMLQTLMEYDFGYMFAVPVDIEAVAGYKETVKKPMDLGTICTKLTSGGYMHIIRDGGTLEDVVITVLQDVELVWHNCFSFNFEGSAIYRMAAVQRRRALAIQKKSFDHLLSDRIKSAVSDYVRSCEVMRGPSSSTLPADTNPASNAKEKELRLRRPKGKHKITVKIAKPSVNRAVAIFDQVTGRIVKIYSSMKSASHAAHSLFSLGHRCEWSSTQDLVKQIVAKGATDPSVTLFGYRWLMLDELRAGKVAFHDPAFQGIQVRHGDSTHTFLSVDEAMSFHFLEKALPIDQIRTQLSSLETGGEWTSIGGRMWRALVPPGQKKMEEITSEPESAEAIDVKEKPEGTEVVFDKKFLESSTIIKEDIITKRTLVGFQTCQSAFIDWKETATLSPVFPPLEVKSMDNFVKYYLDGDRNVDGLVWRSHKPKPIDAESTSNEEARMPLPAINGFAPSPLVRSADKKRRESNDSIKSNGDTTNEPGSPEAAVGDTRKRIREDEGCLSNENPSKISAIDGLTNRGMPLMGIQLFKQNLDSNEGIKRTNCEESRMSKDASTAAS